MPSLWRNRDFNIFWLVQTISVAGDSLALIAIPLLVLHATGSVAQMGLLTGAAGAAAIATGFFAGAIADRVDRRSLLIVCDVARAVLYGVIPFAGGQIWVLYVVVPLAAVFGMIFQVGYVTAVPNLVGQGQITDANGRLFATQAAAGIGGMLLAGLLSGAYGPSAAVGLTAAGFAFAAAGLALVRLRKSSSLQVEKRLNPWQDFKVGLGFLWRHPVLRALTVLLCFFVFVQVGLTDLFIYYLKAELGQPDKVVGYVMSAATAGTIAGSLLVGRLRRSLGFGVCWIGSTALFGVSVALAGMTRSVPGVAILATTYVFFLSIGGICSFTLRQEITPDHLLGRVTSTFWTIQRALSPLGAAALTAAAGQVGVTQVLVWTGIVCVLIGLAGLFTPVRLARPELA
ncbi:MFS transporter [Allorhizocola rhizosphaerae]|uniref:MFS transporter n=1 Tax=Allorhizocola rhizosphaerae TaxID=1872709 RepID=UPI000E3ECB56|nr:MFS transporter [Allorhizocola rhizosphaerae]